MIVARRVGKGIRRLFRGAEGYMVLVGISILLIFLFMAILAPFLSPYDPTAVNTEASFQPPSSEHLMGTDKLGKDMFSRFIWGTRTALAISALSALLALVVGVPTGLFSGFIGGKVDRVMSMFMDALYAFPGLILAMAVATMLGYGVINVAVALAVIYAPTYFRVIRNQVLSVREQLYVEAARALGTRDSSILGRYILPNVIPSIVVILSLCIADAILTAAGLSFIGVGISPEIPDWGYDISKGVVYLRRAWWTVAFPGLAIVLIVVGFSLLGEGLDEIINPKLAER